MSVAATAYVIQVALGIMDQGTQERAGDWDARGTHDVCWRPMAHWCVGNVSGQACIRGWWGERATQTCGPGRVWLARTAAQFGEYGWCFVRAWVVQAWAVGWVGAHGQCRYGVGRGWGRVVVSGRHIGNIGGAKVGDIAVGADGGWTRAWRWLARPNTELVRCSHVGSTLGGACVAA